MPKKPRVAGVETSTSITASRICKSFRVAAPPSRKSDLRFWYSVTFACPSKFQRDESGGTDCACLVCARTTIVSAVVMTIRNMTRRRSDLIGMAPLRPQHAKFFGGGPVCNFTFQPNKSLDKSEQNVDGRCQNLMHTS